MALMSIGKFAKEIGMSVPHVRKLQLTGEIIPAHITQSGHRYYSTEQVQAILKSTQGVNPKKVIGYCRVSTSSQKDDLETQIQNVKMYMLAKGYAFDIITDVGSGINYHNKGLKELIRLINNQEISRIVILYKDRLVRFGFELIEYLCELNDVQLEIIDQSVQSKEQELTDDLIQIITVFANRLYGSRSKKTKQLIQGVTDVTRNQNSTPSNT